MKVYGLVLFVFTLVGTTLVQCVERDERQVGEIVVPIVMNVAEALFKKILSNWIDKDNMDVVFIGRAFRIHTDSAHQVTVSDRASGVAVTIKGATLQAATSTACQELVKKLLQQGVMSIDDLHLPPTMPPSTLPPCVNLHGDGSCNQMVTRGYCESNNVFHTFMVDNCYQSCTKCI